MNTISLNIFTNATESAPNTAVISRTLESIMIMFGPDIYDRLTFYLDPHPGIDKARDYYENIKKHYPLPEIKYCQSLSDGYLKSIRDARTDYIFQCEHDWEFLPTIKHSLDDILYVMKTRGLYHFRFNKRENKVAGWDTKLEERLSFANDNDANILPMKIFFSYCLTPNVSNNPHIIDVKKYRDEIAQHIIVRPGSLGIEREINAAGKYQSAIYGPLGYPATVRHLDGRGKK